MKQYTDITILLDRSGSMQSIKGAMEEAFDSFIKTHRKVKSTKISLIEFNSANPQRIVYQAVPVGSVEKLRLRPDGGTPLLDATCVAIDNLGSRLAEMDEKDRPDQVLFVIITDGQENDSKRFKRQDVFNRITKQRSDYKWQFVYLGANQDTFAEAASFGIPQNWALNYLHTYGGASAASNALAEQTLSYTSNSSNMRSKAMPEFTKSQRQNANNGTPTTKDIIETT